MLSPFEHFASQRNGIDAQEVSERTSQRLSPSQWAKAIFEHWKSQQPAGASVSEEAFAEAAKLSRGGLRKLFDSDRRPRHDTTEKLRAVAPAHLKDPYAPQDPDLTEMSDPDRTVLPSNNAGAYVVKTYEGRMVAEAVDELSDAKARRTAVRRILNVLDELNPHELGAGRGPGRAQRK